MAAQAPAKVGFLGLGVMGKAMAGCLAESGLQVMAWNRTAAVAQELAAAHPGRVTAAAAVKIETKMGKRRKVP